MLEVCTIICLGVKRHLVSGHEISKLTLQHGLQLIMARYTRIINCRPCCNLYVSCAFSGDTVLRCGLIMNRIVLYCTVWFCTRILLQQQTDVEFSVRHMQAEDVAIRFVMLLPPPKEKVLLVGIFNMCMEV